MVSFFRRLWSKKTVDKRGARIEGKPVQIGTPNDFNPDRRLNRALKRARICKLNIEGLQKAGADTSVVQPWIDELSRRMHTIKLLGG